MLWMQVQRIIRLFMVATLVLATIPHTHQLPAKPAAVSADHAAHISSHDHDGDEHHHDEPADQDAPGHSHGPATADHVHDKPFPSDMLTLRSFGGESRWQLAGDQIETNAPHEGLERPPRSAVA